jgi:hypothetical protein
MNHRSLASKVYPEDIQCVLEPGPGSGSVFIGNKEAA